MKATELLTLAQAERAVGMRASIHGRRLRRYLESKERQTGKSIIRRDARGWGRVTLSLLRRHCPELFPSQVDELAKNFKTYLHGIDAHIEGRVADYVTEHVDPRLEELWQRDEQIAGAVKGLAERVKKLAQTDQKRPKPTTR